MNQQLAAALMIPHGCLRLVHSFYVVVVSVLAWIQRRSWKYPNMLTVHRSKLPVHLCLNLVSNNEMGSEEVEEAFLECLRRVVRWCREVGIETLTVYDRDGVLVGCRESVHGCISRVEATSEDSCESEVEYPLTPPLSEPSGSRSQSPDSAALSVELSVVKMNTGPGSRAHRPRSIAVRHRPKKNPADRCRNLALYVLSRDSAKPAIASVARSLLQSHVRSMTRATEAQTGSGDFHLSVSELGAILEGGLFPPDLMIVHNIGVVGLPRLPLELHGFPPWQIMLTEFHYTRTEDLMEVPPSGSKSLRNPVLISETSFCRALDEYADAQFRLGR